MIWIAAPVAGRLLASGPTLCSQRGGVPCTSASSPSGCSRSSLGRDAWDLRGGPGVMERGGRLLATETTAHPRLPPCVTAASATFLRPPLVERD